MYKHLLLSAIVFITLLYCVTCQSLLQYSEVIGDRITKNFETRFTRQVRKISVVTYVDLLDDARLTPNRDMSYFVSLRFAYDSGPDDIIGSGLANFYTPARTYTFADDEFINSIELRPTPANTATVGFLSIITNKGSVFWGKRTKTYRSVNGENVEDVLYGYSSEGIVIKGVYGTTSAALGTVGPIKPMWIQSLGFIFNKDSGDVEYGTPSGTLEGQNWKYSGDQLNYICCKNGGYSIGYLYASAKSNYIANPLLFSGNNVADMSSAEVSCLNIADGETVNWETVTSEFTYSIFGSSSITTSGVASLKVTRNSDKKFIECKGSTPGKLGARYESGFKLLKGIAGFTNLLTGVGFAIPIFVKTEVQVTLVAFKLGSELLEPSAPKTVTVQRLINGSDRVQSMTLMGSYSASITKEIKTSTSMSTTSVKSISNQGAEEIEVGVGGSSVSASYSFTNSKTSESSFGSTWSNGFNQKTEETFTYDTVIEVPAMSALEATVLYYETKSVIPWSGLVKYTFSDGTFSLAEISGTFVEDKHRSVSVSVSSETPV